MVLQYGKVPRNQIHSSTIMTGSKEWSMSMASGGKPHCMSSPSGSVTVFSNDGRYSIVFMTHEVRVYFVATRQCIRTLSIDMSGVVEARLDNNNNNQIIAFKNNGEIIVVNWREKISQPIISTETLVDETSVLSVISVHHDSYFLVTGKKDKKSSTSSPHTRFVVKVDRATLSSETIAEVSNVIKYSISLNKKKLAFALASHELVLIDLSLHVHVGESNGESIGDNGEAPREIIPFTYKSQITSLAVSNDSVIAIGTSSGAIQILYGGIEAQDRPQRLLKWHIDQVKALQFTPDNNYLLSGGLEKVLVFWQLETDKTQFLPRLNGTIEKISIDYNKSDYYTLVLNIPIATTSHTDEAEEEDEASSEVLVVSAVDLVSRLSVNGIRPKFVNSNVKSTLAKTKKKFAKAGGKYDVSRLKHDYTSIFEVHPKSQNLYFPRGATIQAYDLVRNEQAFTQNAAPMLSIGKVRSENKLVDPEISAISFTQDGEWMCTFDTIATSEVDNLLSKNDLQYALKFWKYIQNSSGASANAGSKTGGYWELSTKIIDPHGPSNPILSITAAPLTFHEGISFLTADDKGGLRVWRPRIPKEIYQSVKQPNNKLQQTAWTLRKSKPCGALVSNAVSTCWSDDGSIIVLGHECSITAFNTHTFEEIAFQVPAISGSRIRSLSIVGHHLIVLSKTRITSLDLLSGKFTPLVAKVNTTLGGRNLIAVDKVNELVCLAINYYNEKENNGLGVKSKILMFKPDQLEPVFTTHHDQGVSSLRHFRSLFIFVDLDSRVGLVSPVSVAEALGSEEEKEQEFNLAEDMSSMLLNAQATADIVNNRSITIGATSNGNGVHSNTVSDAEKGIEFNKVIDVNIFQPVFENLESVQIDTLFDRIIKITR